MNLTGFLKKEIMRKNAVEEIRNKYKELIKQYYNWDFPPRESLNRFLLDEISNASLKDVKDGNTLPPFPKTNFKSIIREINEDLPKKIKPPVQFLDTVSSYKNYIKEYIKAYNEMTNNKIEEYKNDSDDINEHKNYLINVLKNVYHKKLVKLTKKTSLEPLVDKLREIFIEKYNEISNFNNTREEEDNNEKVIVIKKKYTVVLSYLNHEVTFQNYIFKKLFEKYNSIEHMWIIGMRYQTLMNSSAISFEGTGQHGAVPKRVFDVITNNFPVKEKTHLTFHEAFASPFNNYLPNFFSAFPDIDSVYGSQGSFFHSYKKIISEDGYYEVNPPFSEILMENLYKFIIKCLSNSEKELVFLLVIPYWKDSNPVINFLNSKFKVASLVLEEKKHSYISGSQHLRGENEYLSVHETILIWLQNTDKNLIKKSYIEKIKNTWYNSD